MRGMPHDRHEARSGGSDWLKRPPNYHTTGSLRGGKMRWPRIFVCQTTRVFALEIRGIKERQDHGPQCEGCWFTLPMLQATKRKLPRRRCLVQPLLPLVECLQRKSSDVAAGGLQVFLAYSRILPAGRVARA